MLSRDVLVSIFMGCALFVASRLQLILACLRCSNITQWNDRRIQSLNTAMRLPADQIVVGVRSGVNGLNAAFSTGAFVLSACSAVECAKRYLLIIGMSCCSCA